MVSKAKKRERRERRSAAAAARIEAKISEPAVEIREGAELVLQSDLLMNEDKVGQDCALISKHLHRLNDEKIEAVWKRMKKVLERDSVGVVTKFGVVESTDAADVNATSAGNVVLKIVELTQKRIQHDETKNKPSQPMVQVGVKIENNPDAGRTLAAQVLQRIRSGGVSQ